MPGIGVFGNGVPVDQGQIGGNGSIGADIMRWMDANPGAGADQPLVLDRGTGPSAADAQRQFNAWLRRQQAQMPPQPSNDIPAWEEFMRSQRQQGGSMTDAYGNYLPMQYWLGV